MYFIFAHPLSDLTNSFHFSFFLSIFRSPRDSGYGHGGCNNDAFSVFGFLAFLLAAANLFMAEERRRKRDTQTE